MAASAISVSVAPALRAPALWISMQYGHWVVSATARAISSLYFTGMAPAATAALSKAQKAFITSGARVFITLMLARFSLLYIVRWLGCWEFRIRVVIPDRGIEPRSGPWHGFS